MKKNRNLIGLAVLLIAILVSCGKMPQAEHDAAQAVMDSLKAHKADVYLADEFEEFEEVYENAMESVKAQESKTFKSYGDAKEQLQEAAAMGEELLEQNTEKEAELREEVEDLYEEAYELNNDNKNNIPKRGGASTVMAFQKDVNAIASDLEEVKEILDEDGNLMEALDLANEALEEAEDVSSKLASAVATSKPAKKPKTTHSSSMSLKPTKKK